MFENLSALLSGGTKTKAAEPVPILPESPAPVDFTDDKRPVDETEEARTDLALRTPGRIAFLLRTYEAGRIDRTQTRITNDLLRHAQSGTKSMMYNRNH
jgi:hypothetical protein